MLNELFSSGARVKILKLFLLNPKNKYYQREIALMTKLPIRAVQREAAKLKKIGIFEKSEDGNRTYYNINPGCPIIPELKSLFIKTAAIGDLIKEYLKREKSKIKIAFIYGSYAKQKEELASDIDLFVVGSINAKDLSSITSKIGREIGRELNYIIYSEEEFKKKKNNQFISNILKEPKIFVVGEADEIAAVTK